MSTQLRSKTSQDHHHHIRNAGTSSSTRIVNSSNIVDQFRGPVPSHVFVCDLKDEQNQQNVSYRK